MKSPPVPNVQNIPFEFGALCFAALVVLGVSVLFISFYYGALFLLGV